jgi:hypothetical protein
MCVSAGKALCRDFMKSQSDFELASDRVWSRFARRMGLLKVKPADWQQTLAQSARSKEGFQVLEQETLKEIGETRQSVQSHFEIVRDAFLETVQAHSELPASWRAEMINKVSSALFVFPSESGNEWSEECGPYGLSVNAFAQTSALPPFGFVPDSAVTRKVVACPGIFLQNAVAPGIAAYDYILAHELGHFIDSRSLTKVGKDLVLPYFTYMGCLKDTLGIPVRNDQMTEIAADFWGAEVFARLNRESAPDVFAQALSANALFMCLGDYVSQVTGQENWSDTHLPDAPRMSQAMIYNPAIHKLLGCAPFTRENPGCDLSGNYPRN